MARWYLSRGRLKNLLLAIWFVLALIGGTVATAMAADEQQTTATVSLIVKMISSLTAEEQAAVIARGGGVETSSVPALQLHVVELPESDLTAVLSNYHSDPQVVRVEFNGTRKVQGSPSDPDYGVQWALQKIGWDTVFGNATPTGTAKVALLDTGVDSLHPDLAGKLVPGFPVLNGSSSMTDPNGHGTYLSGIIAAVTDNGQGVAGVGYSGVSIMPVTVLGADGTGTDSDIISGLIWAVDNGANVVLMGFSNPGFSQNLQDAIDYAWSKGVVLVAATGNDASSIPTYPAGSRGVIGVSATDQSDSLYFLSNFGPTAFLAAPGVDIYTTAPGGTYQYISGTSASSAAVAGVAAFMKAANPDLTNGAIVGKLARNADPAGTQEQTGNGRINMARSLEDASLEEIQPAGVPPVGDGGPFVGPYVIAARNWVLTFAGSGSGSVTITPNSGTVNAPVSCGGTGTAAASQTVTGTCSPNITTSENGATVTFTASANIGSVFAGWSGQSNLSSSTCSGTTNPCSAVLGGNAALTVTFTANSAPTISDIANQSTNEDAATSAIPFTVGDAETAAGSLTVSGGSSNTTLVPNANIVFGGSGANRTVTITPAADQNGTATITVTVSDGSLTASDTFVLIVNAVNDAPSFTKGADQTVNEDAGAQSVANWATAISAGPANEAGQTLTFNITGNTNPGLFSAGPAVSSTGTLTYTPAADANGSATITLRLSDNGGTTNGGVDTSAAQTFTITLTAVNDSPSFTKGADQTVNEDALAQTVNNWVTNISAGPSDESGQTLDFIVSNDNNALFSAQPAIDAFGTLTYTPAANANGSATVTVQLHDNGGTANSGVDTTVSQTFTITITPLNDTPSASDTSVTTDEDTSVGIDFGPLVSDVETADANLTYTIVSGPSNGGLSGSGQNRTYTPNANFNGTDSFTYKVTDRGDPDDCGAVSATCTAALNSDTKTITITVTPVNDKPTASASPASPTLDEDSGSTTITLSGSDVETAAANLTFTITQIPAHGSLKQGSTTLALNDTFIGSPKDVTYTPNANYNGADSFKFKVTDLGDPDNCGAPGPTCAAALDSDEVTISITVYPMNDQPTANGQSVTTNEDTAKAITLTGFDVETASGDLTYTITQNPAHGSLSGSAPNLTYTPDANYNGADSFKFKVSDRGDPDNCGPPILHICTATLDSTVATVSITVNSVNDAPVVGSGTLTSQSVQYSDPIASGTIVVTDVDNAGSSLSLTGVPAGLTVNKSCVDSTSPPNFPVGTSCTFTLSGNVTAQAGSYPISVNDGTATVLTGVTITVTKETITSIVYMGMVFVTVPSGGSANVQLSALITEQSDGNLGNITLAKVKFIITGDSGCPSTTVGNVSVGITSTPGTGTACAVVSLPECTYTVTPSIDSNPYYDGLPGDPVPLTVAPATGQFITGGGWIPRQATGAGLVPGDLGSRMNFGLTVKWNKKVTNLQGNSNYIIRQVESGNVVNYQVKSTAADNNLTVIPATATTPASATFTSKAVIRRIVNGVVDTTFQGGNARLRLDIVDVDSSGRGVDSYAMTVWDGSNNLFHSSNWNGTKTVGTLLGGGNVVVHDK